MAWCSRTERSQLPGTSVQTSTRVGPGAYDVDKAAAKKTRPSYAPFASTTERSTAVSYGAMTASPGPGYYARSERQQRARVSGVMRSQTQRFRGPPSRNVGPGPGQYVPPGSFEKAEAAAKARARRAEPKQPAVKWVRVPTVPSIPSANSCWGYAEGEHGELVQQQPAHRGFSGTKNDTPGPLEYRAAPVKGKAKGAQFGKSRSRRTADELARRVAGMPGPGSYNAREPKFEPVKPSQQMFFFQSRVRRGMDTRKAKQGPGPGSYTLPSAFKSQKRDEALQFFGSSSERFPGQHTQNADPGPAPMPAPSSVKTSANVPPPTNSTIAFASTASRFKSSANVSGSEAGPGSYSVPTLADDVQKKLASRTGVFGSTTKRFFRPQPADGGAAAPGPGSYTGELVQPAEPEESAARRPFQSSAPRFSEKKIKKAATGPAPGLYDPVRPLGADAPAPRLASGPARFKERPPDNDVSPGEYAVPSSLRLQKPNRRNVMGSVAPRFVQASTLDTPGPGSYDAAYIYDGLIKPTFNMTVAE